MMRRYFIASRQTASSVPWARRIDSPNRIHTPEMTSTSTAPPIRAVEWTTFSRFQSSAPHSWAVSTPTPMVAPMIRAFTMSIMGAATLIPDRGRFPRNLPTTTASTMLYSC